MISCGHKISSVYHLEEEERAGCFAFMLLVPKSQELAHLFYHIRKFQKLPVKLHNYRYSVTST